MSFSWTCVFSLLCIVTPSVVTGMKENVWNASGTEKDGAGVQHSLMRTVRSTTCILPPYPDHGTYSDAMNGNNSMPGQSVDIFILSVSCQPGYGTEDAKTPYGNSTLVLCSQGVWYQTMPKCVRYCKLDRDPSVHYMCHRPDVGLESCDGYLAPGTVINPVCNSPNYYSTDIILNMECISGLWNYVAKCKADCGRMLLEGGFSLIKGGKDAWRGQVPWHVGIYRKASTTYEQICGGSIVSNNVVISAAHCVSENSNKALPPSGFGVTGGKIYRPWDDRADVHAQKSDVKEIKVPRLYQGADGNFGEDIAVLILATPFVYNSFVKPVCLNFDVNFNNLQLQHGKLGKVAGWGLTSVNGTESPVLQVVDLPFIDEDTCITTIPPYFRPYITGDKFCAGFTNGTAMCLGDSGGGLAFPDIERGIKRFYLRGIVSTAPTSDSKICNDNTYLTFTKVLKHQDVIISAMTLSERRTCQGADCTETFTADETCEWDGFKGTCVPAAKCITTLNKAGERPPVCPDKGGKHNHICCTDCQPVNDTRHFAMVTGWVSVLDAMKDGGKARNACLQYLRDVPHMCYQRSIEASRESNTLSQCHTFNSYNDTGNFTLWGSKHPYMVSLGFERSLGTAIWYRNSAVIISEKFILTSAVIATILSNYEAVRYAAVGNKDYTWNKSWQTHQVKKFHLHPDFSLVDENYYNNIALLELYTAIIFSPHIYPACLTEPTEELNDTAISFHWIEEEAVEIRQITTDECNADLFGRMWIKAESQICYKTNNFFDLDAFIMMKSSYTPCMKAVTGIVNLQTYEIVVSTKVKPFIPWIESIVWP